MEKAEKERKRVDAELAEKHSKQQMDLAKINQQLREVEDRERRNRSKTANEKAKLKEAVSKATKKYKGD